MKRTEEIELFSRTMKMLVCIDKADPGKSSCIDASLILESKSKNASHKANKVFHRINVLFLSHLPPPWAQPDATVTLCLEWWSDPTRLSFLESSIASAQSSLPTNFYMIHYWMKQMYTSLSKHFEESCLKWFSVLLTHTILPHEILFSCLTLSFFFRGFPQFLFIIMPVLKNLLSAANFCPY